MKAIVSITLDDEFVVHDIKVIEGEKGLFIAMPSKKATDGEYRDIAHPINSSTRENLQRVILESYEKALEEPEGKMKAIVSITLDDEFVVHDIKVIEGEKGLFIAMPSKKATDGEYRDIAHPINSSTRENLQRVILESYEKALEEPEEAI